MRPRGRRFRGRPGSRPLPDGFPESADIRSAYWASFFSAPEQELQRREQRHSQQRLRLFQASVARSGGFFYAIAAALEPAALQPAPQTASGPHCRATIRPRQLDTQALLARRRADPGQGLPAQRSRHLHPDLSRRRPQQARPRRLRRSPQPRGSPPRPLRASLRLHDGRHRLLDGDSRGLEPFLAECRACTAMSAPSSPRPGAGFPPPLRRRRSPRRRGQPRLHRDARAPGCADGPQLLGLRRLGSRRLLSPHDRAPPRPEGPRGPPRGGARPPVRPIATRPISTPFSASTGRATSRLPSSTRATPPGPTT